MIAIQRNIPIPQAERKMLYPFAAMEVGDSFAVDGDKKVCATVSAAVYKYKRENPGKKFTVRTSDAGIRVWRIE